MKYFLLSAAIFTHFFVAGQDLSGYWTGMHDNGLARFNAFEDKHRKEIHLKQNGCVLTGIARCINISTGFYSVSRLSGLVLGKKVILVENDLMRLINDKGPWSLETLQGDLVIDSVKKILTISGRAWSNKYFVPMTGAYIYGENFSPPGEFTISKPFVAITDKKWIARNEWFPDPEWTNNDTLVATLTPLTEEVPVETEEPVERKVEVVRTFNVASDSLDLSFYDDGEIDGDTISVYYNNVMVLGKQRLTDKPLTIRVPVIEGIDNELVMFADNTGTIPPNTAIMIFYDKGIRKEVKIDSDTRKSGAVVIRKLRITD